MRKVGLIGYGSMGSMLLEGFLSSGALSPEEVVLSTRTKSKLDAVRERWPGVAIAPDNTGAAQARHLFLCVKPVDMKAVLDEIVPSLPREAHIVSIAGTVPMAIIEGMTGCPVTKLIPTVTSEARCGVSLVCHGGSVSPGDAAFVEELLCSVGVVKSLPEQELALATELTSCMPGFVASIFQEMVESAMRHAGLLSRADAEDMLLKTLLGTARLLSEKGMGFDGLITRVATPGGITEEGVKVLREGLPAVFGGMFDRTLEKRKTVAEKAASMFCSVQESVPTDGEPIPYIPLKMSHGGLSGTPVLPLPQGYSLRLFRPGEEATWADIVTGAGEFDRAEEAMAYFRGHFAPYIDRFEERCLFLLDGSGDPVGTTTGWFMDDDPSVGRLHWVSIKREHQGRGLSKPMVAAAMRLMADLGHVRGMLTTQPKSWKGIKVYLQLGWKPYDDGSDDHQKGWELVRKLIQ